MIYLVTGQKELFNSDKYEYLSVEESLQLLDSCKILQYDSETSGLDCRLGKILCIQFGNKEQDFQIVIDTTTINVSLYKDVLETKYLIGHNLKFDLQWLYNYNIIPRNVYDTMIVEQLLYLGYPSEVISYSLASVAKRRLNIDIDKSIRGQIIWRGLDEDVVMYSANDVKFLEDIMISQLQSCKERNCIIGAKLECDFVPAISYLEWCGIKLDENKWKEKMTMDKANLDKSLQDLNNYALNHPKLKKWVKQDLQGDLFSGFDTEPKWTVDWQKKEVVEVVKTLGFNVVTVSKQTQKESESVMEKVLKTQKGIDDTFLKLYFDYQGYYKVCSSFGQGHLNAINPKTGRLHTIYKQLGAASGRMSCGSDQPNKELAEYKKILPKTCTYPNIQQLPHDKITRSCFVAEENNLFCSCDFSALESRLGADIYNEQSMIEEFLYKSGDIHSLVAKACFPELKDLTTEEIKKKYPDLRSRAKPIGFSQQFGGSANAIASSLGCSLEEAEAIANAYLSGFPGIAKFKSEGSKAVRKNGYVLMCKYTGHKMYWWDHNKWLERQKSFTQEFWEEYRNYHKGTGDNIAEMVTKHFKAASKWDRMALNAPTQNTGVIILKDAITNFFNYIVDNNLFNVVKIVALVHDEANIEYPKELPMDKVLKSFMEESASKYCKSLPIPAEASVGEYWIH